MTLQTADPRSPARWLVAVLVIALGAAAWLANRWAESEREATLPSTVSGEPGFRVTAWSDPGGTAELADAQRHAAAFAPLRPPAAGSLDRCVWYRLEIDNPTDAPRRSILEVSNEFLQEGELYPAGAGGEARVQRTGAVLKWDERAVPGNRPAFPLTLPPRQTSVFFLRIADSVKQPRSFLLWNDAAVFERFARVVTAEHVGYLSLWLGLFAYNGFLYAVLRRADYFRYLVYLLWIGALVLVASDLTSHLLPWPHWPLRAIGLTVMMNFTTFSLLQFSRTFLETAERRPQLDRWLVWTARAMPVLAVFAPAWLWPSAAATYEGIDFGANIVVLAGLPVMGVALGLRRTPQAWLYVLAFLPTVAGFIYVLRDNVGLPEARSNGMPVLTANALELVFLALALAWRYRHITDEARTVSLQYTARLEASVTARTRELQETNDQLARANREKEQVLAVIGHDLRGPANMLHTLADALSDPLHPLGAQESSALAEGIKEACEAQLVLLDNLLQWGRIQAGDTPIKAESQPVSEVVLIATNTLTHLARTKGVHLTSQIPEGLMLSAAPQGAQTIVRNVVGNALKFTPAGGFIAVSARSYNRKVEIEVRDNGVGMSEHRLAELLAGPVASAAGTQEERGAGIGLTLCRDLARASGGDLQISSELGRGTTVRLSLPEN